jgi:Flp pilus assembly protein TadD
MILELLAAAAAAQAAAAPSAQPLGEATHAIEAGRLNQARIMIGTAIKAGAKGEAIDRLLADLAFASGEWARALTLYEALLQARPANSTLAERAAIAAVRTGQVARAARHAEVATASPTASWKAWNASAVIADHQGRWDQADAAYAKALSLAPQHPEVLNNIGWSLLVRGRWEDALERLEQAAAKDPGSDRIANNLELARAAVSEDLPRRRPGESDTDWAARLNDAGVIARIQGQDKKAIAAFTQAIRARSEWFERAANNLALAEGAK